MCTIKKEAKSIEKGQKHSNKEGFTLIELLIVVAIIAILAAIAIPNFLAAQIRSKVARIQAELRNTGTAMESYYVDNNTYPFYDDLSLGDDQHLSVRLTTPVSYMSSLPLDVYFNEQEGNSTNSGKEPYHYLTEEYSPEEFPHRLDVAGIPNANMKWMSFSIGPDQKDDEGELFYDPTNGTVSPGDIVRLGP